MCCRYILATKFPGETCPWCIVSALLSFSIAGLSASGMGKRELQVGSLYSPGVQMGAMNGVRRGRGEQAVYALMLPNFVGQAAGGTGLPGKRN